MPEGARGKQMDLAPIEWLQSSRWDGAVFFMIPGTPCLAVIGVVPTGRGPFGFGPKSPDVTFCKCPNNSPGTPCLATIVLSLRNKNYKLSPIEASRINHYPSAYRLKPWAEPFSPFLASGQM
jgi:hypothetical protein